MKLPKEKTLWNWVFTGFGLIIGVAIIGIMNMLNESLNMIEYESAINLESDVKTLTDMVVYYSGKIIAMISGCFTTGAIIKIARPEINYIYLVVSGFIFMFLSLIDLIICPHPMWYQVFSVLITIPSVILGNRLIKSTQYK